MKKNFKPVVALINALNVLDGEIRSKNRFDYRVEERSMYIMGLTCDLANLYSLLWADCDKYCIRFTQVDRHTVLECY